MNERDVQRWIWQDRWNTMALMVPNYTPDGWFECDMFAVTKAGYFYEYEIKLTKADLRADMKKRKSGTYKTLRVAGEVRLNHVAGRQKHTMLAEGDERGPSVFFYVVPVDLVGARAVPSWAGLIYVGERGGLHGYHGLLSVVRQAPRRHQTKVARKIVDHARGVCYHRFWNERLARDRALAGVAI